MVERMPDSGATQLAGCGRLYGRSCLRMDRRRMRRTWHEIGGGIRMTPISVSGYHVTMTKIGHSAVAYLYKWENNGDEAEIDYGWSPSKERALKFDGDKAIGCEPPAEFSQRHRP